MQEIFNWKERYKNKIADAKYAIKSIKPGYSIFIGTGCAQPQMLVNALVDYSSHIYDAHVVHMLTMGDAPYVDESLREKFKMNSFFIADNVRHSLAQGIGDYTPIFLSEIPAEFESGRIPLDVALITVTPPDANGLCSLGVSVDIVKSAIANSRYVIAQVNSHMPRTYGDSFVHVNTIDTLVPGDEKIVEVPVEESDDVLRRIGQNIARLVEDGSTIECGIGKIPQAMAEFLKDKKDLGIHTEMFSDWIIDLIDCGAITCAKKTMNRGKVVASFCMGSKRLYDYINENPFFEFHPTEYVNDVNIISQHEKMVGINVGLEIDLTGQVCADSIGYQFYSGIGGQVDFIRGCSRSRGGKPIIAMPSTAKNETISRIVPTLTEGAGVVTTRGDVHYVVTEYGIAYLHGKSIRQRALDLINIAHPKFRKDLLKAAKKQNYVYEDQIELSWDKIEYPKHLERYDTLIDGTEIFLRPVKPNDETALTEMLYSLSEDSKHKRFMSRTVAFPHKDIQQVTNVDYQNNLALVGVVPSVSGEDIVAIGQYFVDPATNSAEVAFVVQDEWQKKGMGTLLLKYLSEIASKRNIKRFNAKVMRENRPMLAVFHNSGYNVKTEFDGEVYDLTYDLDDI